MEDCEGMGGEVLAEERTAANAEERTEVYAEENGKLGQ